MSILKKSAEFVRDNMVGFAVAAVPTFMATAATAGMFALGMGVAGAIGLGTGLSFVAGGLLAVATLGATGAIGVLAGAGALAGMAVLFDSIPFMRSARPGGLGVGLGVVAGLGASAMLAFNLAGGDPQEPVVTPEVEPAAMQMIEQEHGVLSPVFASADYEQPTMSVEPGSTVKAAPMVMAL